MIFRIIAFAVSLALIGGCASMGPPGGGPEDKEPPVMGSVAPPSGSVKVPPDATVKIEFSEPVEPRSLKESLFISPTPASPPRVSVHGRTASIRLRDPLPRDRTTVITLGAGVQDLHGNRMAASQTIALSAGGSLDSGRIAGEVYSPDGGGGMLVGLWAVSDSGFDPKSQAPMFLTQTGERGDFELNYLPKTLFRIACFDDRNRDRKYAPGVDHLGLGWRDLIPSADSASWTEVYPTVRDTLGGRLIMASATDNRHIALRFAKTPKLRLAELVTGTMVHRADSSLKILAGWFEADDSSKLVLYTEIQDTGRYELNLPADTSKYNVNGSATADTTMLRIVAKSPKEGDRNMAQIPVGWIGFDDGVGAADIGDRLKLFVSDSIPVAVRWHFLSPNILSWRAAPNSGKLRFGTQCRLTLNPIGLTDLDGNGSADSALQVKFTVIDPVATGSISGTVSGAEKSPVVVVARQLKGRSGTETETKAVQNGAFLIESLEPGNYRLWSFEDLNGDGRYDYGQVDPFKFAERMTVGDDTLQVRARWETSGAKLEFK